MAQITRVTRNQSQKDIIKAFDNLQGKHNMHQLWSDFVVMMACTISNAVDAAHRDDREKTYLSIASQYTEKELNAFAEIFAIIVEAYEANSNQDLLGELFMGLGLGNDSGGQFFTPYDVCRCTAELTFGDTAERIKDKGWVSVNDPAVGAGALLIAFANICEIKHINYQQHVLFVAQEIDFTTACMCYIQLSLLGCPGYVYVGNTITDPCTSIDGNALTPAKPEKCWFTPMYFHQTWVFRRMIEQMKMMERQDKHRIETKTAEIDSIPAVEPAIETQVKESEPEKIESTEAIIPDQNAETELLTNESGQLMLFLGEHMKDYKTDLCDKLTALVMTSQETNSSILKLRIMQVLNDYQISEACTDLVEWHGDRNTALIQRWIIAKAVAGCTEQTIKYYRSTAERILMKIGKDIDQITAPDVQVYFANEIVRGTSLTTVDNDKRVLSSMYSYLYREEIVRNNPMLRIDPIRREKKKKPAFSDMDIERIRAACRTSREKMIVEVLLSTACRVSEFVNIKYGDIEDGKLTIIGKGKKSRVVYFNAKALLAIEQYMSERKDANPYLLPKGIHIADWPKELRHRTTSGMWYANPDLIDSGHQDKGSIESTIREIGKRAGVENAHPHRFRRTCATNALRKGMPIEMVSKMLGHENIATTQIYLDLNEDDLKAMHGKFVV